MPLRDIVAAQAALAEELPLVHTTRCETLVNYIVPSNELRSVTPCDVFNEHLIYFFYGRPAYRHYLGVNPVGGVDLLPVCFVFKPHTLSHQAKRVYACDSGGVHKSFFEPHLLPADRDEMRLDNGIENARRLVSLLYGSNQQYYFGQAQPVAPASFDPGSPAQRFHGLLTDANQFAADDRRSAIEVQLDSPVSLLQDLLYVLLPFDVLSDPDVRRAIREIWHTDPIGYDVYNFGSPNESLAEIRKLLRDRYMEGDLL